MAISRKNAIQEVLASKPKELGSSPFPKRNDNVHYYSFGV
jgi:hypothetical protein